MQLLVSGLPLVLRRETAENPFEARVEADGSTVAFSIEGYAPIDTLTAQAHLVTVSLVKEDDVPSS